MKKSILFYLPLFSLSFLCFTSCTKDDLPKDLPSCMKKIIEKLDREPKTAIPRQIYRAQYQNETVYYYSGDQAFDGFSNLYNENCEIICHPDGGFSGNGDGRCPDFEATNLELIWGAE